MSGKYMKTRKMVIPTITMIILASQMFGCSSTTQTDALNMIQNVPNVEIEVSEQMNSTDEQNQAVEPLDWTILAQLTTNQTLRDSWDTTLKIEKTDDGKSGILYIDQNGNQVNNNTLYVVMHNRAFINKINQTVRKELAAAAAENYADIDSNDEAAAIAAAVNAYFNLLPDKTTGYSNVDSTLTRAEFMALMYRATNSVQDLTEDETFTNKVGSTAYNIYAQNLASHSFIELDNTSYTGTMTRAEAIYMLVSKYFAGALKGLDSATADCYNDAKDGGNITLTSAIADPESGLPTDLYKALCIAKDYKLLVGDDSRWDEPITLTDAIGLMLNTFQQDTYLITFNSEPEATASAGDNGSSIVEMITVTPADRSVYLQNRPLEERQRDAEDGYLGIDIFIDEETGQSYGVDLITGETYHLGDVTADGTTFNGRPAYNVNDYIWNWRNGDGTYYDDETPDEFIIERWNYNYGPDYAQSVDDAIHGRKEY